MTGPSAQAPLAKRLAGGLFREPAERWLLALTTLWSLLLLLPWAGWLDTLPWIRVALALFLFMVPGVAVSFLLAGDRLGLPAHVTTGLSLSVFLVGALGLLARMLNLPFHFIKPLFGVVGLALLLLLQWRSRVAPQFYRPAGFPWMSAILLLCMSVFAALTYFQTQVQGDNFSYLAYLTTWQHANPLDFTEVIFGSGALDGVRFWLAMFPMSLAFLADISGLHGLLLFSFYLEAFLSFFALLATYSLYEEVLGSGRHAIMAVLIQFTLLLMLVRGNGPGSAFFYRLCEDKAFAAFVLFPVFLLALRCFLDLPTRRTILLLLLVGLSLALTHPIILAYSLFIGGFYGLLTALRTRDRRKIILLVAVCAAIVAPVALLRVVGLPWVSQNILGLGSAVRQPGVFDLEAALTRGNSEPILTYIQGSPFYGFNLSVVQIPIPSGPEGVLTVLLSWAFLWILGLSAIWALFHARSHSAAPLILAASLLLALSAIPYTGWLVGKFVSARMLWRVPWMMPTGLAAVVLLGELPKVLPFQRPAQARSSAMAEKVIFGVSTALCVVLVAFFSFVVHGNRWLAVERLANYRSRLENLAALGTYLEKNVEQPAVFAAAPPLQDFIPGLSSKSKAVYFRGPNFSPDEVNPVQLRLLFSADPTVTFNLRLRILKKYNIRYILTTDPSLVAYYESRPEFADLEKIGGYWIVESLQSGR